MFIKKIKNKGGVIGERSSPKIELFFCKNNKDIYLKYYLFTKTKPNANFNQNNAAINESAINSAIDESAINGSAIDGRAIRLIP